MEVIAKSKFIRLSPKKLNLLAGVIRGLSADQAEKVLLALNQKGSRFLLLLLKQGVANAVKNFGLSEKTLKVKKLEVSKGPSYKRGRPVSRGQWHPILKRTSHLYMVIEGEKVQETKQDQKEDKEAKKPKIKKELKNGTKS
jgi:large subunit ribosomal protein L22